MYRQAVSLYQVKLLIIFCSFLVTGIVNQLNLVKFSRCKYHPTLKSQCYLHFNSYVIYENLHFNLFTFFLFENIKMDIESATIFQ